MAISVGFRSIESGAVANGGEDIVLHAKADDGEANLLLPAGEAPRLAVLLLQLQEVARATRSPNGATDAPILDGEALELIPHPAIAGDLLEIRLGSDATSAGARAARLRVSLPPGALAAFADRIVKSRE